MKKTAKKNVQETTMLIMGQECDYVEHPGSNFADTLMESIGYKKPAKDAPAGKMRSYYDKYEKTSDVLGKKGRKLISRFFPDDKDVLKPDYMLVENGTLRVLAAASISYHLDPTNKNVVYISAAVAVDDQATDDDRKKFLPHVINHEYNKMKITRIVVSDEKTREFIAKH